MAVMMEDNLVSNSDVVRAALLAVLKVSKTVLKLVECLDTIWAVLTVLRTVAKTVDWRVLMMVSPMVVKMVAKMAVEMDVMLVDYLAV